MECVVVKSKFQAFLVPNYRAFRIPVKYVSLSVVSAKPVLDSVLFQLRVALVWLEQSIAAANNVKDD